MPWHFLQEKVDGWLVPEMVSLYLSGKRHGCVLNMILLQTDRVVKLWDLHQEDMTAPSCSFTGPGVSL
jgi:hypothetical protein